jgi:hypothetical protein
MYSIAQIDDLLAGKSDIDHTHPEKIWVTENFTLTASEITSKQIILAETPSDTNSLRFKIIGGTEQYEGIDFEFNESTVSWDGYSLENEISEGDQIKINYIKITQNP